MSCYFRKQTPLKLAILFGHRDGPLPEGTCHFMWSHGWLILFGHMDGPLSEGTCHFIWSHEWPIVRGNMSFYLVTWVARCQREHVILFGHMSGPLSEGTCHFIWLHGWPILFGHMDGSFYLITWMTHFMWSNG
jgi:hypothetical protein